MRPRVTALAGEVATTLLLVLVVLGGSVAIPPVLRELFGLDEPALNAVLALAWGVLWSRIVIWGLRRRARLIGKARPEREKATS